MPSSNFKINPQALEILNKIKSGEYLRNIKARLMSIRWILIGTGILILLLLAISIGRFLSKKSTPSYTPPVIDLVTPTTQPQKQSVFSPLKRAIQEFNVTLPDPAIPVLDNNINLESTPQVQIY